MAIKLNQTIAEYNLTLNNSYVKITNVCCTGTLADIVTSTYTSVENRNDEAGKPILINTYQFNFDLNSEKNIYQQGYDFLKTLDEFAGAEDC